MNHKLIYRIISSWQNKDFTAKWKILFILSILFCLPGLLSIYFIFKEGLGILPLNSTVVWGPLIVNFIFWIGIAHAGTFISSILLLLKQSWRNEIHRFAELTTISAIIIAAMMPIIHLGKPQFFYRLFPLSDITGIYLLNFNSPLIWDFYAIITYFFVSLLFISTDLYPEIKQKLTKRKHPSILQNEIDRFGIGYQIKKRNIQYLLALLATPLVISVHSIVSFDFAVTIRPGWHSSIFPFYFVIGAIMSGFAMIGLWAPFVNKRPDLHGKINSIHYQAISKIILGCSILLSFVWLNEILTVLLLNDSGEINQWIGKFRPDMLLPYSISIISILVLPHIFWKSVNRDNESLLQFSSLIILIGMWFERFVIVVGSAKGPALPSQEVNYEPNLYSIFLNIGIVAFFTLFMLLFIRYLPLIDYYKPAKEEHE